jgi:hypothetical protein
MAEMFFDDKKARFHGGMRMFAALGLILGLAVETHAAVVTLHSGNGIVGGSDTLIHFLDGPNGSDFAALTAGDFSNAQAGAAAFIISPHPAWQATLAEDASALWIATNAGGAGNGDTGLYAISFTLVNPVLSGSISLAYAVDNSMGGGNNPGLFLNGTAVSPAPTFGGYNPESTYSNSNIGSLLQQGTNWLYLDGVNAGGPAGLIFTATITTVDGASGVPEPASLALIGGALVAFGLRRRAVRK